MKTYLPRAGPLSLCMGWRLALDLGGRDLAGDDARVDVSVRPVLDHVQRRPPRRGRPHAPAPSSAGSVAIGAWT